MSDCSFSEFYGAVTNWCETLERTESEKKRKFWARVESKLKNQNVNTEEIRSSVKMLRAPPASGNQVHQKAQSFGLLKHLYERAGFYHPAVGII